MMVGSRTHTLLFSLLLLASLVAESEGRVDLKYRHVYIRNGLGNGIVLRVSCKSDTVGLGTVTLKDNEEFKFQFQTFIFTHTLYHCSFTWGGIERKFVIYDFRRDEKYCHDCYWSIKQDRPCRFNNETQNYDICPFDYK
ncbi:unnamed protein product [Lupinus luteus]|uniref:S-protein homolog n=1 Tax=Lupinus luteus TaxID=3873 RepID=A0AAV1WQD7_LUPLU